MNHILGREQVCLQQVVVRIDHADAVDDDGIPVVVGRQRRGVHGPDALVVLLHGQRLGGAFTRQFHFLRVGSKELESDAIVRVDLGGIEPRRPLWRLGLRGLRLLGR